MREVRRARRGACRSHAGAGTYLDSTLWHNEVLLQECGQVGSRTVLQDEPYMLARLVPGVELNGVHRRQAVHDLHLIKDAGHLILFHALAAVDGAGWWESVRRGVAERGAEQAAGSPRFAP